MARRKGLLETVFIDMPIRVMDGTTDMLFGSDDPPKKPKPHGNAQRCPVCDGTGQVFKGGNTGFTYCHGCHGRGYVVV